MDTQQCIFSTEYTPEQLYSIMYRFEHSGAYVAYVDVSKCFNEEAFLHDIALALRFPYYYGQNWNAFDECSTDLDWLSFDKLVIIIEGFNRAFCGDNGQKETLYKHLSICVDYWVRNNTTIWVYLNHCCPVCKGLQGTV